MLPCIKQEMMTHSFLKWDKVQVTFQNLSLGSAPFMSKILSHTVTLERKAYLSGICILIACWGDQTQLSSGTPGNY